MNILELMLRASVMVKLVLVCLVGFSVLSWCVILYKQYCLWKAARESAAFMDAFESGTPTAQLLDLAQTMPSSPVANVFLYAAHARGSVPTDRLRGSLVRATARETQRLHSHLGLLATTGSSTPFIGLFGTVWGIVHAFQHIGTVGSASLAVVAPGIAEALVTTAAGLAAAIPAVIAYNYQLNLADQLTAELESVAPGFLDVAPARGR